MTTQPRQSHQEVVTGQFGPRAQAYVDSAVHAQGEDLEILEARVRELAPGHALDLGSGGGHVAYRLAAHARAVVAADLSADMLAAVAATARARGLNNISTVQASAERLPMADGAFEFLGCRFSAHHWRDLDAGLREARRVLRSSGHALFIDGASPGAALLDTHLQAVELLRDPSHVRDHALSEWTAALLRAGFAPQSLRTWRLRIDFATWIARMRTAPEHTRAIRALQQGAPLEVKAHFAIEEDGSFLLDALMIEARAV